MNMHFLETQDWAWDELDQMLQHASELKDTPLQPLLEGKSITLLFFNPSLRTRTSFELGAWQLGAKVIVLEPGKSA